MVKLKKTAKSYNENENELLSNYLFTGNLKDDEIDEFINSILSEKKNYYFSDNDNSDYNMLKRQCYIYRQLKKSSVGETDYEMLLHYMYEEMKQQYIRKSQIESRAGFLMALWGILFSIVCGMKRDVIQNLYVNYTVMFVLLVASGIISIVLLALCIWSGKVIFYKFSSRKNNLITALEHPEIWRTRLMEGSSNSYISNENKLTTKGNLFNAAIVCLGAFILMIGMCYFWGMIL